MIGTSSAINLSLLEEHFEEVAFLWGQWRREKRSEKITMRDLRALERRIEAHAEALRGYGQAASDFLRERLVTKDLLELWSAAWLWLRQEAPACGEELVRAYEQCAKPQGRDLIVEIVARASNCAVESAFMVVLAGDDPARQMHRLQLAAWRQASDPSVQLDKLLRHAEAVVRHSAWRSLVLYPKNLTPEQTLAGALDENPEVREFALEAAVWAGQGWVLDHCRRAAGKPSLEHPAELRLLAALATEKDAAVVLGLAAKAELGPLRYQLLGSYAQVEAVPLLLTAMTQSDPAAAAAAGVAFTRITGQTLKAVGKAQLPPKDSSAPDDFEKEFLEEVYLPDAKEASDYWESNRSKYSSGQRYSQGKPVPEAPPFSVELDIVSIREACQRAAFNNKPAPRGREFERFPICSSLQSRD
jgi:uncharacterized protein (TIGR02270 family)